MVGPPREREQQAIDDDQPDQASTTPANAPHITVPTYISALMPRDSANRYIPRKPDVFTRNATISIDRAFGPGAHCSRLAKHFPSQRRRQSLRSRRPGNGTKTRRNRQRVEERAAEWTEGREWSTLIGGRIPQSPLYRFSFLSRRYCISTPFHWDFIMR